MTHVLVVGSGVAGLTAALHARAAGANVTVVTKRRADDAATSSAQGGIAGVVFPGDTHESHERDTLRAASGIADEAAVSLLVRDGTDRIAELIDRGVAFDRSPSGELAGGLEGAHSFARILHAGGDATGREIQRALLAATRAESITIRENLTLVDLVIVNGVTTGADVMSAAGVVTRISADAVVLATGGAGQAYAHTTNPSVATGDGIAAAIRAGAAVRDMEFVQFHPTTLADGGTFLVSEAVRGEGAVLIDESGRRFTADAHPDAELAPRDVVARAIAEAEASQDGRPVLLDATALGSEFLARRFPTIDRAVRERGLDWGRHPIAVRPAAHYLMGGVEADLRGRTSVERLFAAGEVARTGVHGANRLASNSLLEGAVFGAIAGRTAAAVAPNRSRRSRPISRTVPARRHAAFDRGKLQQLMWESAGLVRSGERLGAASRTIDAWLHDVPEPVSPREVEDRNLLIVSRAIVHAAIVRRDSVGAHVRSDTERSLEAA
ncbi:L-aspartate oxidase [Microbacterium amylolyticum]|uniref:L-aspartate oxidase n=1 Tax=Microbacterium amylolyticum TaxID=936337 RepID=A0ABS4ZKA6_9MICO|nr:L-aspartate oxidase [Microbacterium amylolyticum]MBP2437726.1 L-aspartate oxidase [Microbacterium amylolyticum]